MDLDRIKAFENLREQQIEVIPKIIDGFKTKKFFILEAPPGSGKSGISISIANHFSNILPENETISQGTYITTHQKILQQQYLDEKWFQVLNHNNVIDNIMSSENFNCKKLKNLGVTCAEVSRVRKQDKGICQVYECDYIINRNKFINGKIGITNIQYFLNLSMYTTILGRKNLIISDEAHSIENNLLDFISIDLSEWIANTKLKIKFPKFSNNSEIIDWIKNVYLIEIESTISNINKEINKIIDKNGKENELKLKNLFYDLEFWDKHKCKLNRTIDDYDPNLWVIDTSFTKSGYKTISFKPILIERYANELIFQKSNKNLLMSATILNKKSFCKSLGIKEEDAEFISLPSIFDKKTRAVHYIPSGKMSREHLSETLPILIKTIDLLLKKHHNVKGILHTNSYAIADYIIKNIDKEHSKRFLSHTSQNRDEVLKFHIESKNPTVLVSPSMTEGVDLKDDLSRFQIVCKIPFPFLGDKRIVLKKKMQPWWYPYTTAKIIIQGLGRSTRNENDFSVSYILDSSWESFFRMNIKYFPQWFIEGLN